jgi:hypothetical protein
MLTDTSRSLFFCRACPQSCFLFLNERPVVLIEADQSKIRYFALR